MEEAPSSLAIFPIGAGENKDQLSVQINKEYIAALKFLPLFSHAIVIYRHKDGGAIFEQATKILFINEKSGACCFEPLLGDNSDIEIIDIKPYFPCEDRVINATCETAAIAPTLIASELGFYGKVEKRQGQTFVRVKDKSILAGLGNCSHIKLFWWFSRFDKPVYRRATECNPPYENAPRTGIFASRSPVRPNPIALTTARILSADRSTGTIATTSLDCFDDTPIIGIAPYNPAIDKKDDFRVPEWLEHWPASLIEDNGQNTQIAALKASPIEVIAKYQALQSKASQNIFKAENKTAIAPQAITVVGARQNNLKNVNVSIPHNKITVVTGVSGSGKSSLVFDTIFAESQYRFFEGTGSMPSTKQKHPGRPNFDTISGLTPAIAVSQTSVVRNPRSTFGTITGLYDLLRSLFAGIGIRHCPSCGEAIVPLSPDMMCEMLCQCCSGTTLSIQPIGSSTAASQFTIQPNNAEQQSQIKSAIADALKQGHGAIEASIDGEQITLQTTQMCYACNHMFFELTPASFSFNNPESCCPVCNGTGETAEIDPELVVPSPELSILDNASPFWGNLRKFREAPNANWMKGEVLALAQKMNVDLELPWSQLDSEFRRKAMFGSEGEEVSFKFKNANGRTGEIARPVEGAVNILKRLLAAGTATDRILELYTQQQICPECHGERLNSEGRLVTVAGKRIPEITDMPISELKQWIESIPTQLRTSELELATPILKEIHKLCDKFILAGLPYISLSRSTASLSGGELQRTRLIAQLASGITNVSYILDEPFTGLHPSDTKKLFSVIKELKENGNTVVMVEHNRFAMLNADNIVDVGPCAGTYGGEIIAEGSPNVIMENPNSLTGQYLSNRQAISIDKKRREPSKHTVTLKGARANNLKNVDISFPAGSIVCICGVSGSGKSSLVEECLFPAVSAAISGNVVKQKNYDSITGTEAFSKIIFVDQKPIGRNSRSTPATYTGAMDAIRTIFAATPAAKSKNYKANRFSFNSKEGQCHECNGEGVKHLHVPLAPDSEIECPCCKGAQFNSETLAIEYKGKNIAQVLQMSVDEALSFFGENAKIKAILQTLHDIGLGYITLGQNSSTVSGGEAQRIKLATELYASASGKAIYILDEPSSGLHFCDVRNLMAILQKIADDGNSVVLVEHNQDIINNADVVIELGPVGGKDGGYILRQKNRLAD